ncbi:hypothetical protein PCANC_23669 [Puccinia coronata f. sp. avenae]|uniref:Uncharacterized protein n=1 Tax=Puccinia coronata f. sp. avenae TaxID=200324 RepID=A0A2N5S653_9BASI|nr:hypothetical protein PCASD_20820 [Puccinia coronata f. sp. avenae]PLW28875.1 hypothetical protein PCANC_23669 [Puccinia coronata f. sp. avenae]
MGASLNQAGPMTVRTSFIHMQDRVPSCKDQNSCRGDDGLVVGEHTRRAIWIDGWTTPSSIPKQRRNKGNNSFKNNGPDGQLGPEISGRSPTIGKVTIEPDRITERVPLTICVLDVGPFTSIK